MSSLLPVRGLALLVLALAGCQAHSQPATKPAPVAPSAAVAAAPAEWWREATKLAPLGSIRSPRASADETVAARTEAETARAHARALVRDLATWRLQSEPTAARARLDASLALRDRALANVGYGNLVLAGAAEDAALHELARLLADPSTPWPEIQPRLDACLEGGPSAEAWRQALANEQDPLTELPAGKAKTPVQELSATLDAVLDRAGPAGLPATPGRLDYEALLENYDPAGAVWLTIHRVVRRATLETCAAVRAAGFALPTEREAFRDLLKEKAGAVLTRRDRLGGPIDSGQAWTAWRQMLETSVPAAQP